MESAVAKRSFSNKKEFYQHFKKKSNAYELWEKKIKNSTAVVGMVILFSVFYGVLLFGEHLSWMAFVGMLLIVVAGLASTWLGRAPVAAKAPPES